MFSEENVQRELHGSGGGSPLELNGEPVPAPGAQRLALPAPGRSSSSSTPTHGTEDGAPPTPADDAPRTLEVGGESVKIDKLGPLIVNTDGTLSRITNWHELTPSEQERMVRLVVKKRNKARLAAQQDATAPSQAAPGTNLGLLATDLPASSRSGSADSPVPAAEGQGDSIADPHDGYEPANRSVEEKIVGLMALAHKDDSR